MASYSYSDALGRVIQQRDSLGGSAGAGQGSQVMQNVSGFRVVKAVLYDGAGRVKASVEPFHSSVGGFQDYTAGRADLPDVVRTTVTRYDALGRPSCAWLRVGGPGADLPALCTSNSTDTASFQMATETRYGVSPPGAPVYLSVQTIPPDLNSNQRRPQRQGQSGSGNRAPGNQGGYPGGARTN